MKKNYRQRRKIQYIEDSQIPVTVLEVSASPLDAHWEGIVFWPFDIRNILSTQHEKREARGLSNLAYQKNEIGSLGKRVFQTKAIKAFAEYVAALLVLFVLDLEEVPLFSLL